MAYDWETDNPLISHYSGDSTQTTTLPWTPPDSSYQRNQSGNGSQGADGSGWQENKDYGGWTRFNPNNNNQAFEYDDNGNQIRTVDVKRSTDLSGLWSGLGTLAGIGLGGYGLMNGGIGGLFSGAGETAAGVGGDAFSTIAAENAPYDLAGEAAKQFAPMATQSGGGLGSLFNGKLSGIGDFLKNPLFQGAPAGLTGLAGVRGLYDMYAKNQMAKAQQDRYDQINNQVNNSYAPGSPEYQALFKQLAAKDAASGRNSQYGARAVQLAGLINQQKNQALAQTQTGQNNLQSSMLQNQYGGLNSLFNILGDGSGIQKVLGK